MFVLMTSIAQSVTSISIDCTPCHCSCAVISCITVCVHHRLLRGVSGYDIVVEDYADFSNDQE